MSQLLRLSPAYTYSICFRMIGNEPREISWTVYIRDAIS
jgi:hypothetical protein